MMECGSSESEYRHLITYYLLHKGKKHIEFHCGSGMDLMIFLYALQTHMIKCVIWFRSQRHLLVIYLSFLPFKSSQCKTNKE